MVSRMIEEVFLNDEGLTIFLYCLFCAYSFFGIWNHSSAWGRGDSAKNVATRSSKLRKLLLSAGWQVCREVAVEPSNGWMMDKFASMYGDEFLFLSNFMLVSWMIASFFQGLTIFVLFHFFLWKTPVFDGCSNSVMENVVACNLQDQKAFSCNRCGFF